MVLKNNAPKVSDIELTNALAHLTRLLMSPTEAFRLPRPCGPMTYPIRLPTKITLKAKDNLTDLKFVIKVNMDIRKHIELYTEGALHTFTNKTLQSAGSGDSAVIYFNNPQALLRDRIYSFPSKILTDDGIYVQSDLFEVGDQSYSAWNPDSQRFMIGKIWALPFTVPPQNIAQSITGEIVAQGQFTPNTFGSVTVGFRNIVISGEDATPGVIQEEFTASQGDVTGNFISFPALAPNFACTLVVSVDVTAASVAFSLTNINAEYEGVARSVVPLKATLLDAIVASSEKMSFTAMDGRLTFGGGVTSAGLQAVALAPFGKAIPTLDADAAIAVINRFPERRKAAPKLTEGAHCSWLPDTIEQYFLQPTVTYDQPNYSWCDTHKTQSLWFAVSCPPSSNLQPCLFEFRTHVALEFETYAPELDVKPCANASLLLNTLVDVLGSCEVASGNPNHFKKIAKTVKKVVNDPAVRMMGSMALQAGKVIAPSLLALI